MKKVLLIGFPFPLRSGGSPRLLGLAKYLPEFGWEPIVMTAPLSQKNAGKTRIIETGYRERLGFVKRILGIKQGDDERAQVKKRFGVKSQNTLLDFLLTRAGEVVNYPDADKGWKPFGIMTGDEIIRQEKVDAIISTSSPVTAHLIAKALKIRHNIPWVADLRDLWSQNHNYGYCRVRRAIDRRLEIKTLSAADALVTVSQPWANELGKLHKDKKPYSITNGFDPELLELPPAKLAKKFTVTYTGTIYPGKQDVSSFFAGLSKLVAGKSVDAGKIDVRFFGSNDDWINAEIRKYDLTDVVHLYSSIPRNEVVQKQGESHLLLLLSWNDQKEKGNFPGKIFEYLAARRPVLAVGGSAGDVVSQLLAETGAGTQCLDADSISAYLKNKYQQFVSKVSQTAKENITEKITKYNHREMARKFAGILDTIV